MKTPTLKSSCCNADLAVHLDSEGTCCYICNNCGSDCDVASEKTPTLSKEAELLITRYEPELVQDFGNESVEMVKSKSGAWVSFDDVEKLVKAREQSAIQKGYDRGRTKCLEQHGMKEIVNEVVVAEKKRLNDKERVLQSIVMQGTCLVSDYVKIGDLKSATQQIELIRNYIKKHQEVTESAK